MQTIWLSPASFVTGDPTLRVSYPFVSHPSTIVSCTAPGDFKWVSMGLRLPPDTQIDEVMICYKVSNARSFIAQVRLAEMTTPDLATVIHDDPAHLTSTTPTSYTSAVPRLVPSGAVTLELRLNFQDASDEILLGAVGINIQSATERCLNSIADLRALAAGAFRCVELLGYYTPGDGGGGEFYWDASSSEPDNGGTIILPASNPPTGRWKRNYSGALNVRWLGAKGDAVTDDTSAINAAIGMASTGTVTATVYFPAGVYMTTGLTLAESNSGITLRGEGTLAPSQGVGPPTIGVGSIIRLSAPAKFLLKVLTTCFRVENLWWDGNQLASDVVQFTYLTTQGHFENCLFTGAVVATGYIHHYVTDLEIDNLSFHRCVLIENRGDWNDRAAACVYNENPQAFQIEYEDCYFAGAAVIAHFANQGSCDFYNGQMFNWTMAGIRVETYCEPFHVENIYNEQSNAPFFQQVLNAGANSARSITIKDCQLNAATPIVFIGTQPLALINVIIGAPITVNPDPAWGVYRLTAVNTTFTAGNDFSGTGYPNAVDEIGTMFLASSGLSRSRIAATAVDWNRTGKNSDTTRSPASYDVDGLALAIGNGTPSTTTVLGDVHWIGTLTADRSYILSSSGLVDGSRIRVSRLGVTDPFTATIKGGVGGGGTAIALSNAGPDTIVWVDWLFDAAGGGWVPVAQGRT